MFWFNMGPRGRKFGHRGFRPGIFLGMLTILLFGGWIILAVLGGLFGAGIMVFGSVLSGIAHFIPRLFSHAFFTRSFIAGLVIGLVWSYRKWKMNRTSAQEEEAEAMKEETKEEAEEPIIETQNYRFYG